MIPAVLRWTHPDGSQVVTLTLRDGRTYRVIGQGPGDVELEVGRVRAWDRGTRTR